MDIRYRREIDGLRAVAVGSILIYHLNLQVFGWKILKGGFLGVDIFFVISGFLIASLIHNEYATTGRFRFVNFYERRARRLIPALLVVLGASYVVGLHILMPTAMVEFAKSALASIAFVSNVFWLEHGREYGATPGLIRPLMHTWSLAVEAQFYVIFPLIYILVLTRVRRGLAWIGLGSVLFGFFLANVLTRIDFSFSFFMIFSRLWELLAGAVLAQILASRPDFGRRVRLARFLPALGLVMIGYSLIEIPLRWHNPGLGTFGAVAGTVLIIAFARPEDPVTRLLSTKLFVGIGLISYSLYLWHYPIYAFGRLHALMVPGLTDYIVWIVLSFVAAIGTYYLVEKPFRNRVRVSRPAFAGALTAGFVLIAAGYTTLIARDGVSVRLQRLAEVYGPTELDNEVLRRQSWSILHSLAKQHGFDPSGPIIAGVPTPYERNHLWFDLESRSQNVLIIGNSHSKDLFNALYLNRSRFPKLQFARFGMYNSIREEHVQTLLTAPNFLHADTVLLSFRYSNENMDALGPLIERLLSRDKNVVLTTNSTEFSNSYVFTIADRHLLLTGSLDIETINAEAWKSRSITDDSPINLTLRQLAETHDIPLLRKEAFMCDPIRESCTVVLPDGRKALYDYGHYALEGATLFGQRIAETGWLDPVRGLEGEVAKFNRHSESRIETRLDPGDRRR